MNGREKQRLYQSLGLQSVWMKMFAQESVTLLLFTEQVEDCALARYVIAANIAFVVINYTSR